MACGGKAVKTDTKSKARIFLRVNTAVTKNIWVHHTGTEYFNPTAALTNTATFTAAFRTGYINLNARLCKREEGWAEFNGSILAVNFVGKLFEYAL